METLAAIDNALNLVKRLREVSSKVKEAEIRNVIADLYIELADVKAQTAGLMGNNLRLSEEKAGLENEIERLKESVRLKGDIVEKQGWYFLKKGDGKFKYPPLCPRCWQVDARLVYLQNVGRFSREGLFCPQCDTKLGPVPGFDELAA